MEWALHSYRNEHSIPIGMESHSLPILKKYASEGGWDKKFEFRFFQNFGFWYLGKVKQFRIIIAMQTGKQQNLSVKNENVAQKIAHLYFFH